MKKTPKLRNHYREGRTKRHVIDEKGNRNNSRSHVDNYTDMDMAGLWNHKCVKRDIATRYSNEDPKLHHISDNHPSTTSRKSTPTPPPSELAIIASHRHCGSSPSHREPYLPWKLTERCCSLSHAGDNSYARASATSSVVPNGTDMASTRLLMPQTLSTTDWSTGPAEAAR